jgi:hypothetical protein
LHVIFLLALFVLGYLFLSWGYQSSNLLNQLNFFLLTFTPIITIF